MNIIIKKFGGTSLANLERIVRAISYIKKTKKLGFNVVVVVSAMGKETDRLLQLTDKLDEYTKSDDVSALLSAGEQISSSLFSIILNRKNIKSSSYQGWQLPIKTNDNAYNAYIKNINIKSINIKNKIVDIEYPP